IFLYVYIREGDIKFHLTTLKIVSIPSMEKNIALCGFFETFASPITIMLFPFGIETLLCGL
ncbi:hypothetical protein, partial [Paenibacillus brasilensis]|uniref:hypothetical protein n=1 Tax=Paenibacillus brasilensis TaxID=128574 RepID=UPI0027D8523E